MKVMQKCKQSDQKKSLVKLLVYDLEALNKPLGNWINILGKRSKRLTQY